jgi:hypothetical protein
LFGFGKNKTVKEYLLRLEHLQITEKVIMCIFSERGGITPLKVSIKEVCENENIFKSISPETLIVLRSLHAIFNKTKNKIKISGVLNKNMYEIVYNDKFKTKITGQDLCQDYELLKDMDIKDAFKVIYNTAFNQAIISFANFQSKNEEKEVALNHDLDDIQPKLRIVK